MSFTIALSAKHQTPRSVKKANQIAGQHMHEIMVLGRWHTFAKSWSGGLPLLIGSIASLGHRLQNYLLTALKITQVETLEQSCIQISLQFQRKTAKISCDVHVLLAKDVQLHLGAEWLHLTPTNMHHHQQQQKQKQTKNHSDQQAHVALPITLKEKIKTDHHWPLTTHIAGTTTWNIPWTNGESNH